MKYLPEDFIKEQLGNVTNELVQLCKIPIETINLVDVQKVKKQVDLLESLFLNLKTKM